MAQAAWLSREDAAKTYVITNGRVITSTKTLINRGPSPGPWEENANHYFPLFPPSFEPGTRSSMQITPARVLISIPSAQSVLCFEPPCSHPRPLRQDRSFLLSLVLTSLPPPLHAGRSFLLRLVLLSPPPWHRVFFSAGSPSYPIASQG